MSICLVKQNDGTWVEKHQRFLFNVYKHFFYFCDVFYVFNVLNFFSGTFFYIYDNLWVWLYCAQYFNLFAQWKYRPYVHYKTVTSSRAARPRSDTSVCRKIKGRSFPVFGSFGIKGLNWSKNKMQIKWGTMSYPIIHGLCFVHIVAR